MIKDKLKRRKPNMKQEKGKCGYCKKQIGETYKYCTDCRANANMDILITLQQINWNLGAISKQMKEGIICRQQA